MGFCLFVSFSYCFCFCCSFVIKTAILNSEHSRRINKGTLERCHRNTESSTEILILHAKSTSSKDLPLVEFIYLEVTRMPSSSGESVAQSCSTCSRTPKLTPSLPQYHLKTTNKNVIFETIELSVFFLVFFALARERTFIKTHSVKSRCYRTGKCTVCMCVGEAL